MPEYDNSNSGALFKNDYKEEGDNKPDYKGPFTDENGEEKEIAAWLRTSKGGKTYLSVKVSEKREKAVASAGADEDVPF